MERAPENTDEIASFLMNEILRGIELRPSESQALLSYMDERHDHLYGPYETYFVLGSYESPFKYRLETAMDILNSRHSSYAYLLAPQPDPELPDDFPMLKVKFYLHALYADYIPLVLEHNTGGALAEFGRSDRGFLFDRTWVFPRCWEDQHESLDSVSKVRARAIELAYHHDGDLDDRLDELLEATPDGDYITRADLKAEIESELGGRLSPSYSGVLTDGCKHYDRVGRCRSWTTEEELRTAIDELP